MKHYEAWSTTTWFLTGSRIGSHRSAQALRTSEVAMAAFRLLVRLSGSKG
jgi:hypothetical protein